MKHDPQQTRSRLLDAAFLEVYTNGYHGAATASILKSAGVPKGSMYHFFKSKKELVLAVVIERIFPKMEAFFDFEKQEGETVLDALQRIFEKMSMHEMLITNGCPLHRLIVEMAPLDEDFDQLLTQELHQLTQSLSDLLRSGIEAQEFTAFDVENVSSFLISATWGILSLPPKQSSKEQFLSQTQLFTDLLKQYTL